MAVAKSDKRTRSTDRIEPLFPIPLSRSLSECCQGIWQHSLGQAFRTVWIAESPSDDEVYIPPSGPLLLLAHLPVEALSYFATISITSLNTRRGSQGVYLLNSSSLLFTSTSCLFVSSSCFLSASISCSLVVAVGGCRGVRIGYVPAPDAMLIPRRLPMPRPAPCPPEKPPRPCPKPMYGCPSP